MQEKERLVRFVLARVVVVSLFLLSTTILDIRESYDIPEHAFSGIARLVVAAYLFSIFSLVLLWATSRLQRALTYLQIVWDVGFVTLLLLLTGGVSSPYSFLYLLTIISASILLSRHESLSIAALCAMLYGAIMDLHYYGKLTSLGLPPESALQFEPGALFFIIFINIVAFIITALLTGYLADRLRASEAALRKQTMDLEELERLNSSIVSNINSGLMTITVDGRLRVFNRYAEQLTGVSQADVYNRPLPEVLPGFAPFMHRISAIVREELEHRSPNGQTLVFGFKSAPFTDKDGNPLGVIIDFQDLTQMKKMKAELERADRLAAIGELSARIAHEIRNPLASISGSVQLIAGGQNVDPQDKRLLDIVLRETERLNKLIGDFLAYARPVPPNKTKVPLRALISDLQSLMEADQRFSEVTIHNWCPDGLIVAMDGDQFRQVFWNLFVNASDAMGGKGTVTVEAVAVGDTPGANEPLPVAITIKDTGAGMDDGELRLLFEPFRSTKPGGTGLGLAMVYRVVEAHGGTIRVSSEKGKGTVFTISLPGE
ncbi:MAG TPA: ATP-binding protein [Geobacteraceae bacterium]|nr:ATP-binding protein [Geobacteraceae bacterium]